MKYLEGWGDKVEVEQIRMDLNGAIGVIVGFLPDGILMQRSDRQLEIIPKNDFIEFEETTFSLGPIEPSSPTEITGKEKK